jgi:hypothetical protein
LEWRCLRKAQPRFWFQENTITAKDLKIRLGLLSIALQARSLHITIRGNSINPMNERIFFRVIENYDILKEKRNENILMLWREATSY